MASNEDILMQFSAQDEISSVIQDIESNVTSSIQEIISVMETMDEGLTNLSQSATNLGDALLSMGLEDVESSLSNVASASDEVTESFDTASMSAASLSGDLDSLNANGLDSANAESGELSSGLDNASNSAATLNANLADVPTDGLASASAEADNLAGSLDGADASNAGGNISESSAQDAASLMYLATQLADVGGKAELMAQDINESEITLDQLAITTGMARDELGNMINEITNASFPHDEAMMYIKNLRQMQVDSSNYAQSATDMDTINDALGLGARVTNSLSTEMAVLGVDMNNVSSSFNALAYANSNTKGGMENFYTFLRKYDAQLNEMGYDMDQTSLIISAATQKYGGGRAALSGLSTALKESGGDARALEQALGMQTGSLDKAAEITGQYEGQLQALADEEEKHKTLAEQLGAAWDDISLSLAPVIAPLTSFMGLIGEAGSFAVGINAMKELGGSFKELLGDGGITEAIKKLKEFGTAKKAVEAGDAAADLGGLAGTKKVAQSTTDVVKDASAVGALAPEAGAASGGIAATGGAMSGIATAFTSMIVPLLAIAAVIAVMIPIVAGLVAEALIFIKGIQILIDALGFDDIDLSKAIEGIKQVGQAVLEIGIAMAEMTFASVITAATALINGITGLVNPIKVAGEMLVQAANEMKVFETVKVDPSVASNLQTISSALSSVSSAMSSLTNVVLSMAAGNIATLGGLLGNVNTAISTAREEITHAADEIAQIKDLPDIDDSAVSKLQKISSSIESVSKAMEGLRGIRDGYNWDSFVSGIFGGVDIQTALDSVKQDIIDAGNALSDFTGIPDIPQGLGDKLKNIGDSLKGISDAMGSLQSLRDGANWNAVLDFFRGDVISALNNSKQTLTDAATALASLQGLPDVPDGIYTKVQRIGTSARNVGNVLNGMQNIPFPNILGMVMIPINIQLSRGVLQNVATALSSLQSLPEIPEGIGAKVQRIGASTRSVASTLNAMSTASFPDVASMVMLPVKIAAAKIVLENVGRELSNLNSIPQVPEGLGAKIQMIGSGARSVGSAVQSINTIPFVGPDVAIRVASAVAAVRTVAGQLSGLQGMTVAGNISQGLASVRAAVVQLRGTLNAMRGGFQIAGMGLGSSIKTGMRAGIAGLGGIVSGGVSAAMSAGVGPARAGGSHMGTSGKTGFQSGFKLADVASAEVTNTVNAVRNGASALVSAVTDIANQAVQAAKDAAGVNSPGYIANMWGDEMGYSSMMIETRGKGLVSSIRKVTSSAVNAFNPGLGSQLAFGSPSLDASRLDAVRRMNQSSNLGQGQRPVSIQIGEGAIQLDARNLTTTESRQVMINALEGLDDIKGIDV